MSFLIEEIEKRAAAKEQAQAVLHDLKERGVRVVHAIDIAPDLSAEDKERLAIVLGGITAMAQCIELGFEVHGGALDLKEKGLLDQARVTVERIDEVLNSDD